MGVCRSTLWVSAIAIATGLARPAIAAGTAGAAGDEATREQLERAIEARDGRGDDRAARAILEPLARGPRDTDGQRDVAARASFLLGDLDERARAYNAAVLHYRDVIAIDPGNWYAATANARLEALRAYDGSFAELTRLDAVRKDPALARDPVALDALERDAASFSPKLRAEALLFVAQARANGGGDPTELGRAIDTALAAARGQGGDPLVRSSAYELAWSMMERTGAITRAESELAADPSAPPAVVARIRRDLRRRLLHRASIFALSVGALLAAVGAFAASRRGRLDVFWRALRSVPAALFVAVIALGGMAIGEAWDRGQGVHFLFFGAGLLAVHLLVAAWRGGFGDRPRWQRVAGGLAAATCVFAAAYLALERGDSAAAPLLEGFGL